MQSIECGPIRLAQYNVGAIDGGVRYIDPVVAQTHAHAVVLHLQPPALTCGPRQAQCIGRHAVGQIGRSTRSDYQRPHLQNTRAGNISRVAAAVEAVGLVDAAQRQRLDLVCPVKVRFKTAPLATVIGRFVATELEIVIVPPLTVKPPVNKLVPPSVPLAVTTKASLPRPSLAVALKVPPPYVSVPVVFVGVIQ